MEREKKFCTNSSYKGEWSEFASMDGYGIYKFANGSVYQGYFKNGEFHGKGTITLPSYFKLTGDFVNGKCENFEMEFSDGNPYQEKDWKYCQYPDRRYYQCIDDEIPPVGESFLTAREIPRKIPPGCYDVEEGFYDPKSGFVMSAEDPNALIRYPTAAEKKWIMENCRRSEEPPVGYLHEIVEENTNALEEFFDMLEDKCEQPSGVACFSMPSSSPGATSDPEKCKDKASCLCSCQEDSPKNAEEKKLIPSSVVFK